jgi:hypothetical protein
MRKFGWKVITVVAVVSIFMVSRAEHYYSLGRAISLKVDQTKVKIRFEDSVTSSLHGCPIPLGWGEIGGDKLA